MGRRPPLNRVPAQNQATVYLNVSAGRLRSEKRLDPGRRGGFGNLARILPAGHGSDPNGFAQDGRECVQTLAPFALQFVPGARSETQRVRARMRTDDVPATTQL